MEDPVDLHQQRGFAYRPRRGRSDPRGLVPQRGDLAAVPVQHPADRLAPEPVLMVVHEGDHYGSRGSSRNSKPPKESHWRVSAPASRRDRRRLLAAPCRRHHPRSCWPGALLESAQNPAWRCRRSYWELAADALWGQRPSADSPLLAWSPSNAGSPHLRHRSAISRAVR